MDKTIKKLNVLHLIDTTGHGGAETILKSIVCGLENTRFRSFVLLNNHGWLFEKLHKLPNTSVLVFNGKGRFNLRLIFQIRKIIRKYKIDIIHTHLFGAALYGNLASIFLRIPVVSTLHGVPDWRPGDFFNKLKLHIIFRNAKSTVFVSKYLRNYFYKIITARPQKTVCIYNGTDFPINNKKSVIAKRALGYSEKDILIASVGNIKPIKGYDTLLRAAEMVINKNSKIKFAVAGAALDSTYQELINLRDKLRLEKKFEFLGYIKNPDIVYSAADIFVLPSISEGFSLAVIEAMARLVPVIATKSGGPEEIIENNVTGKLVTPNSPTDIACAIEEILNDLEFRKKLTQNAYNAYTKKFTITKMIYNYTKLYSEMMNL